VSDLNYFNWVISIRTLSGSQLISEMNTLHRWV